MGYAIISMFQSYHLKGEQILRKITWNSQQPKDQPRLMINIQHAMLNWQEDFILFLFCSQDVTLQKE